MPPTISIITAVFNDKDFIGDAIKSVLGQTYPQIEYIIIDGGSTDGTIDIIKKLASQSGYANKIAIWKSEPDIGIYDALNKGIKLSSGDVIGFLHSDDLFADEKVIEKFAGIFTSADVDIVYSDLVYVSRKDKEKVIRHWKAGSFSTNSLNYGWMPPHTTLFARKSLYDKAGLFDTGLKIASDYDMMLRLLKNSPGSIFYSDEILVKMRVGGKSNSSLKGLLKKSSEDYKVLKKNNFSFPSLTLLLKNVRKVKQFFKK